MLTSLYAFYHYYALVCENYALPSDLFGAIIAVFSEICNYLRFLYFTPTLKLHSHLYCFLILSLIILHHFRKVIVAIPNATMTIVLLAGFLLKTFDASNRFVATITLIHLNFL